MEINDYTRGARDFKDMLIEHHVCYFLSPEEGIKRLYEIFEKDYGHDPIRYGEDSTAYQKGFEEGQRALIQDISNLMKIKYSNLGMDYQIIGSETLNWIKEMANVKK